MVFARNVKAESFLGRQFREQTIRRLYWAIVAGHIEERTIDTNMVRDRGDGRRGSSSSDDAGKRAITHVSPLEHLPGFTVIQCRLETGEHSSDPHPFGEAGHPVCGDKVYGPRSTAARRYCELLPQRLALHAAMLGFIHPASHRMLEFEAPLPADLSNSWKRLKAREREAKPRSPRGKG